MFNFQIQLLATNFKNRFECDGPIKQPSRSIVKCHAKIFVHTSSWYSQSLSCRTVSNLQCMLIFLCSFPSKTWGCNSLFLHFMWQVFCLNWRLPSLLPCLMFSDPSWENILSSDSGRQWYRFCHQHLIWLGTHLTGDSYPPLEWMQNSEFFTSSFVFFSNIWFCC